MEERKGKIIGRYEKNSDKLKKTVTPASKNEQALPPKKKQQEKPQSSDSSH